VILSFCNEEVDEFRKTTRYPDYFFYHTFSDWNVLSSYLTLTRFFIYLHFTSIFLLLFSFFCFLGVYLYFSLIPSMFSSLTPFFTFLMVRCGVHHSKGVLIILSFFFYLFSSNLNLIFSFFSIFCFQSSVFSFGNFLLLDLFPSICNCIFYFYFLCFFLFAALLFCFLPFT
jgi:hypothetical protein